MGKHRTQFRKATLSICAKTAHVHVGAVGKGHRQCSHNATKTVCKWVAA